jgi:hypothetical protein
MFFMWDDEYAEIICELGDLTKRSDALYNVEMGEWKKQTSHFLKLAEKKVPCCYKCFCNDMQVRLMF